MKSKFPVSDYLVKSGLHIDRIHANFKKNCSEKSYTHSIEYSKRNIISLMKKEDCDLLTVFLEMLNGVNKNRDLNQFQKIMANGSICIAAYQIEQEQNKNKES